MRLKLWSSLHLTTIALSAQVMTIDWSAAPRTIRCPSEVSRAGTAQIVVDRVNDVLYQYDVDFRVTNRVIDDLKTIGSAIIPAPTSVAEAGPCATDYKALAELFPAVKKAWEGQPNLNPTYNAETRRWQSIALTDTVAAVRAFRNAQGVAYVRLHELVNALRACGLGNSAQRATVATVTAWLVSVDTILTRADQPSHSLTKEEPFGPDQDAAITVTETYLGGGTTNGSEKFECKPTSGVLSFSGGILASTVPIRNYANRRAPSQPFSTDVTEILNVEQSRISPVGVALMNYNLPIVPRTRNWYGISLSAGPAFRLGGDTKSSSFGFFGGASVSIWRRFFLTPGVHFGQFADIPVNFVPNAPIPPNFGETVPNNRWTAKFALGVTFGTPDFAKAASSARQISLAPPPAAPPKPPADPPKPPPADPAAPVTPSVPEATGDTSAGSDGARRRTSNVARAEGLANVVTPAASGPSLVIAGGLNVEGNGCPLGTSRDEHTSTSGNLKITFGQFRVSAGQGKATCTLALPVTVPQGWRVAIGEAEFRGTLDLPDGAGAAIQTTSGIAMAGQRVPNDMSPPDQRRGPYQKPLVTVSSPRPGWSECGGQGFLVFQASIEIDPSAVQNGRVQIETMHFNTSQNVTWRRCQ